MGENHIIPHSFLIYLAHITYAIHVLCCVTGIYLVMLSVQAHIMTSDLLIDRQQSKRPYLYHNIHI